MIILDNVKHGFNFRQPNTQNLFIILPTSLMWIMEEFCVCFTFMYVLCIDFVHFIDYSLALYCQIVK